MYYWVVFLHVASVFVFLIAHGASANMAFQLRRIANADVTPQTIERLRGLLDLARDSLGLVYIALVLIIITGVIGGFMGSWWGRGWIWAAIGVLVLTIILMIARGTRFYLELREALGMEAFQGQPQGVLKSPDEIRALLQSRRPLESMVIGFVGLFIILWLMVLKPF